MFQILAQMLDLHTGEVPAEYRSLLPFLLTPAAWQQKGSVPGLVKLLKAFLSHDATVESCSCSTPANPVEHGVDRPVSAG